MATTARQRRSEKTRQSILDAARTLVARKGQNDLSLREIAREIDYSPAGLYEYFDSKEEIIQALCMQGHQLLTARILQVDPGLTPAEYLVEIGLAYIDFALKNPEYYLLMFANVPSRTKLDELMSAGSSYTILLGAVQRGIEAGVFKTGQGFGANEIAYAAWSMVHGIAMLRITYFEEVPLDFSTADREALKALGRGLRAD